MANFDILILNLSIYKFKYLQLEFKFCLKSKISIYNFYLKVCKHRWKKVKNEAKSQKRINPKSKTWFLFKTLWMK